MCEDAQGRRDGRSDTDTLQTPQDIELNLCPCEAAAECPGCEPDAASKESALAAVEISEAAKEDE